MSRTRFAATMAKTRVPGAMSAAMQSIALFLNANLFMVLANLLLVLITAAYVWLTWQTLRALQQASLREREARHLQDIRDNVIQPIISWINVTVMGRFTGKTPELLTVSGGNGGKPRQLCHTVDDPFTACRHLSTPADPDVPDPLTMWTSTESGRISNFLYGHAKEDHFREELDKFDQLLEEVRQLTAAFVSFANERAKEIAEQDSLLSPRREAGGLGNLKPAELVAECIQSLLQSPHVPPVEVGSTGLGPQLYGARLTGRSNSIAEGRDSDKLKKWCELALAEVRKRWEGSDLPQRVRDVLKNSASVRRNIEGLLFTHSLGVDCELVSGRKRYR